MRRTTAVTSLALLVLTAAAMVLADTNLGIQGAVWLTNKHLFYADPVYSHADWSSWGQNNLISITSLETGVYRPYSFAADGTGKTCLTCSMTLPVSCTGGCSAGNLQFSPDGNWTLFLAQKAGSDSTLPPGNGSGYDVWISDYPLSAGPWRVSNTAVSSTNLWPMWNKSGTRWASTQLYAVGDTGHPQGYWELQVYGFNAAAPATPVAINTCTVPGHLGLMEPGQWYDDTYIWVIAQKATSPAADRTHYIGFKINTDTCNAEQVVADDSSWTEFGRFPFLGAGPFMFWTSSKSYPQSSILALMSDEWYQDRRGYTVMGGDTSQQLTFCNVPGDPMYTGVPEFCVIHGFSPDGTKVLISRQFSMGTGSQDPREVWMADVNMREVSLGYGLTFSNGVTIR